MERDIHVCNVKEKVKVDEGEYFDLKIEEGNRYQMQWLKKKNHFFITIHNDEEDCTYYLGLNSKGNSFYNTLIGVYLTDEGTTDLKLNDPVVLANTSTLGDLTEIGHGRINKFQKLIILIIEQFSDITRHTKRDGTEIIGLSFVFKDVYYSYLAPGMIDLVKEWFKKNLPNRFYSRNQTLENMSLMNCLIFAYFFHHFPYELLKIFHQTVEHKVAEGQ